MATYKVKTNKSDYAPGSTATILAQGFTAGSTLEFRVQHVIDPGQDLMWGTIDDVLGDNTGSGHESWFITDGGAGDSDGVADGTVETTWYVNPDDSLGATFLLTATGRMTEPVIVSPDVQQATGSVTDPVTVAPVVQVATATFTDSNPLPVQFFYVPKPEDQLLLALQTIENGGPSANPINPVQTYVSIAATAGGTIIYYDQWEDGYETNIANPTQSTTQIWGDGVLTNGVAPGTNNDLITAGTVLVLNNAVDTNVPVMTDYDGGDKIGATKTVAMARIGWASGSNTLLATGLEVFDTDNYGTNHIVPVGVNIPDTYDFQMFEYTGIFIQAGELGAVVDIDTNADGTIDTTVTLTQGQSYLVNGGVHAGARVLSDNPVQVGLMTGDIASNYESRDAALLPREFWSNSYYTPVSTPNSVVDVGGTGTANSTATTVWLYNPGTSVLNVNYDYRTTAGVLTTATLSVPGGAAGGYLKQVLPDGSGAHFYTNDPDGAGPLSAPDFYAISTTNSTSGNSNGAGNQGWDWGFDLVPESSLTTQVLVGLGLGRDPTSSVRPNENGMPAWVTPVGNGETAVIIYVDYNGDNLTNSGPVKTDANGFHYDTTLTLRELERAKVFDPDGDQTGMLLYTLSTTPGLDGIAGTADDVTLPVKVKLAAAWGQDPTTASFNEPGIDTGTGVPPLPTFAAGKTSILSVDADGDGFTSPGDTLLYTISIPNTSRAPVLGLLLQDTLSIDTSYITGTTKINYDNGAGFQNLADAVSGTPFLFDEGGTILGDMAVGKTFTVTFEAKIDAFADLTPGIKTVINTGKVTALGITVPILAVDPLYGSIGDFVWKDLNSDGVQDGGLETGIGGVVLNLYQDTNNNGLLDDGPGSFITSKTTGSNGGYLFTGLLAGSYIVDVVDSTVPANYQLTTNNDPKPVALAGGQDYLLADFGYQPVSSISGYVYKDAGDDGVWDGTSAGIAGANMTLTGYDDLGNFVVLTATTDANGFYTFTDLRPSDLGGYTVTETQPAGYFDGKDTAGSTGGDTTINDQISSIVLPAGVNSINNNFGELPPGHISGYVYKDAGNDGVWDGTPAGISGATVSLSGVDNLGNPVNTSTTTSTDGSYNFANLRPGTYTVTETQPVGYLDGKDTTGTATPGSTAGSVTGNDVISGIVLDAGGSSVNNNFGEILPGALSGFVYVDLNNSGTRQAGETPIGNVTLTLTGTNDLGPITPVTTTTNTATGFYTFGNLRPGTYTVTETQPAAYVDGLDTRGNAAPIAGSNSTDLITGITVVSGATTPNNNFGELQPATVSGFVYVDANNNGTKESTETGIGSATPGAGVTVTLTGINDLGNAVSFTTTTDANGAYSFTGLRPSSAAGYTVKETQPSNYVDGKDTAGSTGGNATAVNDQISGIVVASNGSSANNNFGELIPVSVSGYVYADSNNDGIKQGTESGISSGATNIITLTGTNDLGQAVSLSTVTDSNGFYSFGNLRPSNLFGYTVTETQQPAGYVDGKDTAGSAGGDATVNEVISGIVLLTGGSSSVNNNFGELLSASISGFVYADTNNDGTKQVTEAGIGSENPGQGVLVALTGTDDRGNAVSLTTTTQSNGSYTFGNLRPSNAAGYTVSETQPAGYLDGKDTAGSTGGNATAVNDKISAIVLTQGVNSINNNFGELLPASISGFVYVDTNNDGIKQGTEAGIGSATPNAGVPVTLTGINDLGQVVSLTTTTDANGAYTFGNLRPSNSTGYTVTETTQPSGYLDGKETAGSTGGITSVNEKISAIILNAGVNSVDNNFGELPPASISGFVYADANNDGIKQGTETGIGSATPNAGVLVTLTGINDIGQAVSLTTYTDANGAYTFGNLRPSNASGYTVVETQPAVYLDGKDTVGSAGGIVSANDTISAIVLNAGVNSQNNNFGELTPSSIRGFVYADLNNDGVKQSGEAGIGSATPNAGVPITLTGTNDLGQTVSLTTYTDVNGAYSFDNLRPSNSAGYTVTETTQPAGYVDGKETAGTAGGNTTVNEKISNIVLNPGVVSNNNNFGELLPASLSGFVYVDLNNDGIKGGGEAGIGSATPGLGVTVTLTGVDDQGNSVSLTTTTNGSGAYTFGNLRPSNAAGYTVTETQPSAYVDGKDTAGSTGGNATAVNDKISAIVLNAGVNSTNNNFGELPPSTISGFVYLDADNDGIKDVGELGIGSATPGAGVTVTLLGTDDRGAPVSLSTTTLADGSYSFGNLRPSNAAGYTVIETQPAGYIDGKDTAGTAGGNTSVNDVISGIVLGIGLTSANNNFGERPPAGASLSGFVYADTNNDGIKQSGEAGIGSATVGAGVLVTLTGTDSFNQPVSLTTTTLADGSYSFNNLVASNASGYTVKETQPSAYLDGKDTAGSLGGNATAVNDQISGIVLATNAVSINNNFGELVPAIISGYVYSDANNDGIKQGTESGISTVTTITLTGINDLGQTVSLTTTTDGNGFYTFGNLRPSNSAGYTVTETTQPAGFLDGKDTAGTAGGNTTVNEKISAIVLGSGVNSQNNNFGELLPSSVSGYVYYDVNNNGQKGDVSGEIGIGATTITLTGINDLGQTVSLTTTTDGNGFYTFGNLRPSNSAGYTVTETTQPPAYLDGKETAGTTGGNTTVNEKISAIVLNAGVNSQNNNFGELLPASITGFVYIDVNDNGLKGSGETGIGSATPGQGVLITLTGINDLGQTVSLTTYTDANGAYTFGNLRPSNSSGYSVSETQPAGYLDGKDSQGNVTAISGSNLTDTLPAIVLAAGTTSSNNNFGELLPASISGYIYSDTNNDGIKQGTESGISSGANNIVTLTGTNDIGQSVSLSVTANSDGFYSFNGLRPSNVAGYTVTEILQPAGYLDGKETAGSTGGSIAVNEKISAIPLTAGANSVNNNFGEVLPATLSGFVYVDSDNDGIKDVGEAPISGVTVTLTGTNDLGTVITMTTTTNASGAYTFGDLRPSNASGYTVTETQPSAYLDGKDTAGSAGGSTTVNDKISNIVLVPGTTSINNNFGELPKTPAIQIVKDASVAFTSPNVPVTYTYSVYNTGFIPLSNVTVKDDNATPTYTGDDFNPKPLLQTTGPFIGKNTGDLNGDNLLDTTEVWHYTATVIPPVQMTVTTGGTTYESGTLSYIIVSDGPDAGDVRVFYRQSLNFNDNTYGTGTEGWGTDTHTFSNLTGSDKAGFEVKATDGTVLFKFYQDYISSTTTNTDGYTSFAQFASLGYAGGDGGLENGGTLNGQAGTLLKDFDSTLEVNLNRAGYTTMIVNSPSSDPNWDKINGYMFTIDNSAFTSKSFGGVTIFDQHNSPAKTGGSNTYIPDIKGGVSVNTASVTGQGTVNGTPQTVTDDDTASVIVLTGPLGSLGDQVWFDSNANGVKDSGENGIANVTVLLSGDLNGDGGADYTATAVTNASGLYTFTGLPAGNYTVTVNSSTLPASYTPTYDLDGISSANTATASLTAGQNRTDFDFGYVATAPGFSVDKSADKAFIAAGGKVTYTYNVSNTGSIALSNVVIKDDNGTPGFAEDDFNPTALVQTSGPFVGKNTGDVDGDNLLDPTEVWHYTATVTPPVTLETVVNGNTVNAGTLIITQTLANGDVRVTYLQDQGVNDNTYGTGAASDWPSGHTFSNLTGSDNATFKITNAAGVQVLLFDMDYISSTTVNTDGYANFSGYASLGLGGDGGLTAGNAAWLTDFDSTLELNLNRAGYTTTIVNSPVGDSNWNNVNGYSFTVKAAAFAGSSFGTATVVEQHNSPSKTGTNATFPTPIDSEVTNTAVVTATLTSNGQSVVAIDDATVSIITGPLGSVGDRVWFDSNANGLQESGEAGISGLTMLLSGDFDGDGIVEYTATTTTNTNGNYTFTVLPAGTYTVTVNGGLPANYTQTYDLDGLSTPNMASAELAAGQNRTNVDFGYVGTAPGFSIDKSANKATAAVGESVTYTYLVHNTGSLPLSNVVVKDDNGTPGYAGDDFLATPILSSGYNNGDTNTNNLLDTNETWSYTATVIPPIELSGTVDNTTFVAGTLLLTKVQSNGDVIVTYRQSQSVNDNTYGTGAASDWPSGHTFSNLTGSDKMGFEVTNGNGAVVLDFYMDYLSSATTNDGEYSAADYSGYRSLGVTGGDGSISIGSASNLYDFDSTLELNLNRAAYKTGYLVNSPLNDPNWDYVNGVSFTIKAAAFGSAGFGTVTVPDQHNSPSKLGVNSFTPVPTSGGLSTNTAVVTATLNGNTVVALDDATVLIGEAAQSTKFFVIDSGADDMYKYSASGTAGSSFALQSGNTDPRGLAASADGSKLWVLDKDKNVNVYHPDGTPVGLWKADDLGGSPEGITLDGNDLWLVDSGAKKIFWYDNAANNTTGTDVAEKTFTYDASVGTPKGIVTDGTYLWMVNDNASIDHVSRFTIVRDGSGAPTGLTGLTSWNMVSANTKATGLTIDPTGASQSIWVVDDGTNQVFEYFNARDGWSSAEGTHIFNLASGNTSPQDIADPLALIGDTAPVNLGDADTSTIDSGLNGDELVSLSDINLAGETLWADALSADQTDAGLSSVASLLDNQGSLDFGSAAVADVQVAIAADDAPVEVVNLATQVFNDPVWMAA